MQTKHTPSRREFLRSGGAAVGVGAFAMSARSYAQVKGANERLHMGIIGCGGMASHHLEKLLAMREEENLAIDAVCDVYTDRADKFQAKHAARSPADCMVYKDYRELLDRKELDYVLIATPEHSHAYLTLDALDAGKHVYVQIS